MELSEYLEEVRKAIAGKGKPFRELEIDYGNQLVAVGGQFNKLIEYMLSHGEWDFSGFMFATLDDKPHLKDKTPAERVRIYLRDRQRAYEDWKTAPVERDPKRIRTSKSEIFLPRETVPFKNDYLMGFTNPMNDDINDRGVNLPPPYDKFKAAVTLERGWDKTICIPDEICSARGVLYFGEYALARKFSFAVGWEPGRDDKKDRGLIFLE